MRPFRILLYLTVPGASFFSPCGRVAAQRWSIAHRRLPEVPDGIRRGNFRPLLDFLRKTVHRHGAKYEPAELLRRITGSPQADPACFLSWLRERYLA